MLRHWIAIFVIDWRTQIVRRLLCVLAVLAVYTAGVVFLDFYLDRDPNIRSNLHALTVGLNYRFNWSGGPKP